MRRRRPSAISHVASVTDESARYGRPSTSRAPDSRVRRTSRSCGLRYIGAARHAGWATPALTPIPGTGPYKIASASEHDDLATSGTRFFHEWSHAPAEPERQPDQYRDCASARALRRRTGAGRSRAGRADWMAEVFLPSLQPVLCEALFSPGRCTRTRTTEGPTSSSSTPTPAAVRRRPRQARAQPRDRPTVRLSASTAALKAATAYVPGAASRAYGAIAPYCPLSVNSRPREAAGRGVGHAPRPRDRLGLDRRSDDPPCRRAARGGRAPRARLPGAGAPRAALVLASARSRPADSRWMARHERVQLRRPVAFLPRREQPRHVLRPEIDRQMRRGVSLEGTDPRAAAALWAKIDRELVDQLPGSRSSTHASSTSSLAVCATTSTTPTGASSPTSFRCGDRRPVAHEPVAACARISLRDREPRPARAGACRRRPALRGAASWATWWDRGLPEQEHLPFLLRQRARRRRAARARREARCGTALSAADRNDLDPVERREGCGERTGVLEIGLETAQGPAQRDLGGDDERMERHETSPPWLALPQRASG